MNLNKIPNKLGVMQGRLVPQESKKIQSFPWKNWKKEIRICGKNNFKILEWTVDHHKFYQNPINLKSCRKTINNLKIKHKVKTYSLTADFFMHKPFFKEKKKSNFLEEIQKLNTILDNSKKIGIKYVIIPLVDNSSIKKFKNLNLFFKTMKSQEKTLRKNKQMILFESDFEPKKLFKFIKKFNSKYFGINYDTGNSASLGHDLKEEIILFKYIKNIHIKDRFYKGKTTRLGTGDYNFKLFSRYIKKFNYKGNFIFQTARKKNKDINEIIINKKFFLGKFKE